MDPPVPSSGHGRVGLPAGPAGCRSAGRRVVRIGWFATMPAGLLTATSTRGQRTDLLTVPSDGSDQAARAAME